MAMSGAADHSVGCHANQSTESVGSPDYHRVATSCDVVDSSESTYVVPEVHVCAGSNVDRSSLEVESNASMLSHQLLAVCTPTEGRDGQLYPDVLPVPMDDADAVATDDMAEILLEATDDVDVSSSGSIATCDVDSVYGLAKKVTNLEVKLMQRESELLRLLESNKNSATEVRVKELESANQDMQLTISRFCNSSRKTASSIDKLETCLLEKDKDIAGYKKRLELQETTSKNALTQLRTDLHDKIERALKEAATAKQEKDDIFMKYISLEKEIIDLSKAGDSARKKLNDTTTELQKVRRFLEQTKQEKSNYRGWLEVKDNEIASLRYSVDRMKEDVTVTNNKLKQSQLKIADEVDHHRDTKAKLQQSQEKVAELLGEGEKVRLDCQEMLSKFQRDDLDGSPEDKPSSDSPRQPDKGTIQELEILKCQHSQYLEESRTLKSKLSTKEADCVSLLAQTQSQRDRLTAQSREMDLMRISLDASEKQKEGHIMEEKKIAHLTSELLELRLQMTELQEAADSSNKRALDLSEYSYKLTDSNTKLQSWHLELEEQLKSLTTDKQLLAQQLDNLQATYKEKNRLLGLSTDSADRANVDLEVCRKQLKDLSKDLEDEKNNVAVQQRKGHQQLKDLSKQLRLTRKRLDQLENRGSDFSHASSEWSVDSQDAMTTKHHCDTWVGDTANQQRKVDSDSFPGIDKAKLVDKVVSLQKRLVRKNDKVDFLTDHNSQLMCDLQKKSRLIQSYILREEAGTLSGKGGDEKSKAKLIRRANSLVAGGPSNPNMTLDLSLEINQKLQSVLEDTLIKNITLKESLDTLSMEVTRLVDNNQAALKKPSIS